MVTQAPAVPLSAAEYKAQLEALVHAHFQQAQARIDPVYQAHFACGRAVFKRHWQHKQDIPSDLAALPRSLWSGVRKLSGRKTEEASPRLSGKQRALETILQQELLDLPGLEAKIQAYIQPHQAHFEQEIHQLLAQVPAQKQADFARQLGQQVERLNLSVEGAREALMFCLMGILGKSLGTSAFGSSLAVGQAAAVGLYTSHLSWFGGLWVSLTGVPSWVTFAGAGGGLVAGVLLAPLLAPLIEIGMNRWRARALLVQAIEDAEQGFLTPRQDYVDILGRLAVYLQTLPDFLHLAARLRP